VSNLTLLYVHRIGVILWIGGIVAVALAAALATEDDRPATARSLRAVITRVVTPAMLVAWLGGLGILLPAFTTVYAKAGWMHGKLTLVLIASGLSGVIAGRLRRASQGEKLEAGPMRALGLVVLTIAIVIVGLAVFRPGA
jgi:putative membrane protein